MSSISAAFEARGKVETISKVAKLSHGIAPRKITLHIPDSLYTYTPLRGANTIRLLLLYPVYDSSASIKCELVHVDSQSLPLGLHYEGLSYAWGTTIEKRPITIQQCRKTWKVGDIGSIYKTLTIGKRLDVTENLECALRHIRYIDKMRALWIDAICINQSDVAERNAQVTKMHIIYSMATRVCVWLGPEADGSDQAMVFVEKVLNVMDLENLVQGPTNLNSWTALLSLITRPWFSRRWVVQELAVAREATVFCGTRCVPWSKLANAINFFQRHRDERFKYPAPRMEPDTMIFQRANLRAAAAQSLIHVRSNLFTRHAKGTIFNYRLSLEELLALLPDFYTSDPRDILYALASVAKDTWYSAHDYSGSLPIDYSKDFPELCRDFVYLTMSNTGSLDIICRP
jgi:Heterokaryon incompatibility protein (HET)